MSNELPKQDLLLKILNMTTADNDGQALVAIRKANSLLAEAGWSWEKLLAGKIVVVADPFANIKAPPNNKSDWRPTTPTPPPPPPPRQPAAAPPPPPNFSKPDPWGATPWTKPSPGAATQAPPPPRPQPSPARNLGSKPNKYAGWCYCCGNKVDHQAGVIFDPADFNSNYVAPTSNAPWKIACAPCNRGAVRVPNSPAKRNVPLHPSIDPALQGVAPKLGDL